MKITIADQATAVETAAANLRGHVDNLRNLVAARRRSEMDLHIAEDRLPALEAAAVTLRDMAKWEAA
jgi:hypothetical protein